LSNISVTLERIHSIEPHPNADKLEVAKILGTQTVVPKGLYTSGDIVVYYPPDILLPESVSQELGISKYLKTAEYEGRKIPCRVGACRLRGIPSYGFVATPWPGVTGGVGTDVSAHYQAVKYEPPHTPHLQGNLAPEIPEFARYTDIQNYWKYPDAIRIGEPVCITEKLHGTNSRVGLIKVDGEWQFVAGSHKTVRKPCDNDGLPSLYWYPLTLESVLNTLADLCDEQHNVVIYGELYGPGIQDLDYGVTPGGVGYRVFDITVDGRYLSRLDFLRAGAALPLVPLLHFGLFTHTIVAELTNGPSLLPGKNKFQGREGIVIKPLYEQHSHVLGGRMILKSVSADYLGRKGAQDNA